MDKPSERLNQIAAAMKRSAASVVNEAQLGGPEGPVNTIEHWSKEVQSQADCAAEVEKELANALAMLAVAAKDATIGAGESSDANPEACPQWWLDGWQGIVEYRAREEAEDEPVSYH